MYREYVRIHYIFFICSRSTHFSNSFLQYRFISYFKPRLRNSTLKKAYKICSAKYVVLSIFLLEKMTDKFFWIKASIASFGWIRYFQTVTKSATQNQSMWYPQSTYRGRVEIGECICPLSWSVHHNLVSNDRYSERGWAYTTTLSPGWPNYSIMMECTPKNGNFHSVCTLWWSLLPSMLLLMSNEGPTGKNIPQGCQFSPLCRFVRSADSPQGALLPA
jgi:hypothetical protein